MAVFFFAAGLLLLYLGAESLVRGASRLAAILRIPSLVIGLTVVAYGTSMPELGVSVLAALEGKPDLSLGNVVGSNIFNVLAILGICALFKPVLIPPQLIRWDVPIMIFISLLSFFFALDGQFSPKEGLIFVALLFIFTYLTFRLGKKNSVEMESKEENFLPKNNGRKIFREILYVTVGIVFLILGARFLVDSAIALARALGISELVIALTLVAGGTSLPELATSLVATLKGEMDISVGNIVGSNIVNLLGVVGIASTLGPHGIEISRNALHLDFPVMIGVAFVCAPIFFTGLKISRLEGAFFILGYCFYTLYLFLSPTTYGG